MKKSGKETTEIRFIELGNMNLCLFQNEMYFLHPSLFLNPFSNILIPFFVLNTTLVHLHGKYKEGCGKLSKFTGHLLSKY